MSHQPERKEKNCLNCGTQVQGRYCQACGQENIIPKQSVWGLITHFVYDIFHFDGKFFHTLKHLLFKPGFIPKQYIAGKRMSYLDPIRMYLFTSAVFFLIFFAITSGAGDIVKITGDTRMMSKLERLDYSSLLHRRIITGDEDSTAQLQLNYLLDTTYRILVAPADSARGDSSFLINLKGQAYAMRVRKIIEGQDGLRVGEGWFQKRFEQKWKAYKERFADDEKALLADMANTFIHKFPYILFVSLPFFALILKLLYIRRKQFFYSDHAVFTLYHYIFSFILLLAYFLLAEIYNWLDWGIIRFISIVLILSGGVYLLIAMKRFYGQGWFKTFIKFLLLNILALITILILMIVFVLLSAFQL